MGVVARLAGLMRIVAAEFGEGAAWRRLDALEARAGARRRAIGLRAEAEATAEVYREAYRVARSLGAAATVEAVVAAMGAREARRIAHPQAIPTAVDDAARGRRRRR